jgi:leucyl/phenylalanyl-tRNA--protein transferase
MHGHPPDITADDVLTAYRHGLFPMAESRHSAAFYWFDPPMRGQLPIGEFHIPARLRNTILRFPFDIRIDTDFEGVIEGCAETTGKRPSTWINRPIRDIFVELHQHGHAHSVECWKDNSLVAGVYGLAIGGAFFAESKFTRARDASKIALTHLAARLWKGGFTVFDTQYINPHLKQFGAYEIPRGEYLPRLRKALAAEADFRLPGLDEQQNMRDFLTA